MMKVDDPKGMKVEDFRMKADGLILYPKLKMKVNGPKTG